jgi:hypothetical protein
MIKLFELLGAIMAGYLILFFKPVNFKLSINGSNRSVLSNLRKWGER